MYEWVLTNVRLHSEKIDDFSITIELRFLYYNMIASRFNSKFLYFYFNFGWTRGTHLRANIVVSKWYNPTWRIEGSWFKWNIEDMKKVIETYDTHLRANIVSKWYSSTGRVEGRWFKWKIEDLKKVIETYNFRLSISKIKYMECKFLIYRWKL